MGNGRRKQPERQVIVIGRMSARYLGQKLGMSAKAVYEFLEEMGLVQKDKMGDWTLTDFGRKSGGKMSQGSYLSVPIFELDIIKRLMKESQK